MYELDVRIIRHVRKLSTLTFVLDYRASTLTVVSVHPFGQCLRHPWPNAKQSLPGLLGLLPWLRRGARSGSSAGAAEGEACSLSQTDREKTPIPQSLPLFAKRVKDLVPLLLFKAR